MAPFRKVAYLLMALGLLLGGIAALLRPGTRVRSDSNPVTRVVRRPTLPTGLAAAPAEVREFLDRALAKIAESGAGVAGYQFQTWEQPGKPTRESIGLKAIEGVDPAALIARVMDVDGYPANLAHVVACRALPDPAFPPPGEVRFYQAIRVPRVVDVQQELVLVDAGTIKGYRVAYWYLLKEPTRSLDRKAGARSEFNVGAWLAAPGVVGYALSTWPNREDVNRLQWISLTSGANVLASRIVEDNIDGMAAWARKRDLDPRRANGD